MSSIQVSDPEGGAVEMYQTLARFNRAVAEILGSYFKRRLTAEYWRNGDPEDPEGEHWFVAEEKKFLWFVPLPYFESDELFAVWLPVFDELQVKVGRSVPAEAYEKLRTKIREFAADIGAKHIKYHFDGEVL